MKTRAKIATAAAGTALTLGGIGAGFAYADSPTPAASPSATPSASPSASPSAKASTPSKDRSGGRQHRGLVARALHGEAVVGGAKQSRVLVFQRGQVEKVDAGSITLRSADGYTATYGATADTKVRKEQQRATLADVRVDDRVRVGAVKNGSSVTARVIRDRGPR